MATGDAAGPSIAHPPRESGLWVRLVLPFSPPLDGEDEQATMPPAWLWLSGGQPYLLMGWGERSGKPVRREAFTPTQPSPIKGEGL